MRTGFKTQHKLIYDVISKFYPWHVVSFVSSVRFELLTDRFKVNTSDFQGCYVGQELTARTHHTGVVRKRILPLRKASETGQDLEAGQTIVNEKDKAVGQVRGVSGLGAIGLMRVEEVKAAQSLTVKETGEHVTCSFPDWWPSKV